jgi:RNA polymerase sigma-70 factor (ECF subfamily)
MKRYRAFYDEHREKLFGYLMRMTGDYELSKDILQEAFTRHLERYGDERPQVPLLYTIARNALFDVFRKRGRTEALDDLPEPAPEDQERAFFIREEYGRVMAALGRLGEQEREVLSLVSSGELNYKEIAAITGTNEGSVKVRVHRARMRLRDILERGER